MVSGAGDGSGVLHAEVCVVGGGPAGLTVAAELAEAGIDVVLLEAGATPYDRHDRANLPKIVRDHLRGAQSLTRGRVRGEPYYPLRFSRARGLGGSTNALLAHGLRARPLDPIDLAPRLGASWPIPHAELARFTSRAEVYCGIRRETEPPVDWSLRPARIGRVLLPGMTSAPFRHGRRLHFAEAGLRILEAPQPRVVTAAVVCGFTVHDDMVRSAQVVSLQGKPFSVAADAFVLATGGIDNARLLLGSRPLLYAMDHAAEHVGRFFMEHLHYVGGYLIPSSVEAREAIAAFVGDPLRPAAWLTPDDEVIRSDDLLRVALTALPVHASSLHPAVPSAGELLRVLPFGPFGFRQRFRQAVVAGRGLHRVMGATLGRLIGEDREVFAVAVMSEQAPDPDSRVVLGARSDRFGLPLPDLHWPTRERDFRDARRTIERLAAGIADAGLGRIETLWDGGRSRPEVVTGGWHHMGTTRMSDDPGSGVVDANGKVHGIRNLYAAGSSVFPTSGFANPTLPLVALAVRLADHLAALSR